MVQRDSNENITCGYSFPTNFRCWIRIRRKKIHINHYFFIFGAFYPILGHFGGQKLNDANYTVQYLFQVLFLTLNSNPAWKNTYKLLFYYFRGILPYFGALWGPKIKWFQLYCPISLPCAIFDAEFEFGIKKYPWAIFFCILGHFTLFWGTLGYKLTQ